MHLNGKVAFITGGSTGIGLGIAKACLNAGMLTAITYLRDEQREGAWAQLTTEQRANTHFFQVDVTDRNQLAMVARELSERVGELRVLCNCAGVNELKPMDEATYADWDWVLSVNLTGTINSIKSFLPLIQKHGNGGHILNVGSMASFISGPAAGIYTTSKFAVRGLTECLRYCLARQMIGVSLLCPGLTQTRIFESASYRQRSAESGETQPQAALLERLEAVHANGMHPDVVGRRAFEGLLRNARYIFTHPEFQNELRESFAEIDSAFVEEPIDPRRLDFENARRARKREAESRVAALTSTYLLAQKR